MLPIQEPAKIVSLFYCYANEDKDFQLQLRAPLGQLLRQKLLIDWGPDDLGPGKTNQSKQILTTPLVRMCIQVNWPAHLIGHFYPVHEGQDLLLLDRPSRITMHFVRRDIPAFFLKNSFE